MELSKTRKHIGEKFGYLEIIEQYFDKGKTKVLCKCHRCGENTIKRYDDIKRRNKKDCGCTRIMNKYKNFDKKLYQRWKGMKARCNNPNHVSYKNYGGRGISVCDEWNNDYKAFYNDMIEDFFEGAELDRIDNDKNYSKENCRWVKREANINNRRTYEEIGNYQNKSGFPGIYYRNKIKKYEAYAMYKGDRTYLGRYENKNDAIASRKNYLNKTYGIYE
ncbi:AP2 domain-containing protein [Staphylococcus epidermidis]|uniref:AP2 domain-containing protein n=1 Tax=Staphylococcus epidermidis TaxID=1282 RepID=UPI001643698E|nr:AP2 domain-containing protein [Staphylococcus epidermidis]